MDNFMKILAMHNFHRKGSASGDDQVFKSETTLLEKHDNRVIRYTVSNDEFDNVNIIGKVISTFGMLWSFKNYNAVQKLIKKERPDIVHIHTFFPLLSPSILYAAKRCGVPVVVTLHDTRFVCPCATSLRGTQICNQCGDGHYFRMCKYGCFKESRLQSFLVAGIFKYHRIRKSFYKQIDKYICLNENQINLLTEIGFDNRKIVKKYNFVPDVEVNLSSDNKERIPERYVVFYGRIGEEKGIRMLMKIWDDMRTNLIPLVVMGGGPLEDEFKFWAEQKSNVFFLGYTQHDKCLNIVKGSEFVVFPSIWYEGCSMVEIEAESLGKPLIATDLGFSAETIENGVNGYKVPLGDINGFVDAITELWKEPRKCVELGKNARLDYEANYLPEDNYQQLMSIYKTLKGVM
ncbi:MAG: glycosyltransferase family 4 protein [Clostridiales bacterium]|nr:glycosyltransferase family 4 protein [Clostridiales bacterium]